MAPFNTHFLIAEKLWPELKGPWQPYYGQFCFGCVAPDVDKSSKTLTQKETHFFDRSGDPERMATHRTATFLARQSQFLKQPFSGLPPPGQAFVLGYLCHLCVDEVTKYMWGMQTWAPFKAVGVSAIGAFAALDEVTRTYFKDYQAITDAVCAIAAVDVIAPISLADLQHMLAGVCKFVRAETTEGELAALAEMMLDVPPEEIPQRIAPFVEELPRARPLVHHFKQGAAINACLGHSRSRISDLLAGRIPKPGVPAPDKT